MRGITRINMYALYLKGLRPCKGFLQQLAPAYDRHRHRYRIFTFSLPNQTLYSDLFVSKTSSLPNISSATHAHRGTRVCVVLYHQLAPFLYQSRSGKGSCRSRSWLHTNSWVMGAHPQTQLVKSTVCSRWTEKSPAWGCFSICLLASTRSHSVLLPGWRHKAARGRNNPLPQIPTDPSFLTDNTAMLQESPAAAAKCAGRFPSRSEEALDGTTCNLASPLNCARGKLRAPWDAFGPGNPAPEALSMLWADDKTRFQPAGAEAASQGSPDTQQTSNIPEWALCLDGLCVLITVCASPRAHTAILSGVQLSWRCCCP